MEEENKVNAYMVNQKYPKEIDIYKQKLADYESVISRAAFSPSDLSDLRKKIDDLNGQIQELIEKRDLTRDPIDDKLAMFRQQVSN
jgi:intraflagellar transport protein 81